jgi:hypothetical protein
MIFPIIQYNLDKFLNCTVNQNYSEEWQLKNQNSTSHFGQAVTN